MADFHIDTAFEKLDTTGHNEDYADDKIFDMSMWVSGTKLRKPEELVAILHRGPILLPDDLSVPISVTRLLLAVRMLVPTEIPYLHSIIKTCMLEDEEFMHYIKSHSPPLAMRPVFAGFSHSDISTENTLNNGILQNIVSFINEIVCHPGYHRIDTMYFDIVLSRATQVLVHTFKVDSPPAEEKEICERLIAFCVAMDENIPAMQKLIYMPLVEKYYPKYYNLHVAQ